MHKVEVHTFMLRNRNRIVGQNKKA